MNNIGIKITEQRKTKGLTQEELADLSKVNLRTIQRIENNENEPRDKTLSLICDALDLEFEDVLSHKQQAKQANTATSIFNALFLVIFNFALIGIFGYLTLDSNANLNSRFGGLLLSFLIPITIVFLTTKMSGIERLLKYGSGLILYILLIWGNLGFPIGFMSGLFICIAITLAVLFYGQYIIKEKS
jgi:transcriptional regulator with XRE-family HTH domain